MIVKKYSLINNIIKFIEKYKTMSIIFFIILLLIPNFVTKLIAILGIIIYLINNNKKLNKKTTFTLLLLVYLFAYVFSPYWNLFEGIYLKIASLIAILIIGIFWAKFSSDKIILNFKFSDKIYLVILAILLFIVNYQNLIANIAWRGDEDYHIKSILNILIKPGVENIQSITNNIFFMITVIILITGYILYYQYNKKLNKSKIIMNTIYGIIALSIGYFISLIFTNPDILNKNMNIVTRYPFLMKWIISFFVFPAKYDVSLYRFIPFLSTVLMSWFLYYKINNKIQDKILSTLLAFVFTTIPILFFFSSIVYLEMPIVLLITIVIFDIKSLVELRVNKLLKKPTWYCLLLISFLKETSIIIIILFIIIRVSYQLIYKKLIEKINDKSNFLIKKEKIIQEIRIYAILLVPIIMYFFFRILGHNTRPYGMQIQNLTKIFSYSTFFKALIEQFGIVIIIALLGLIIGLLSKDKIKFIFSTILFIGISLFFISDKFVYIGYARWNLFLVPMILFFSINVIKNLKEKHFKKIIPIILILVITISNIILVPTSIDGVKKPNWGSPLINTAEHTYPYKETFEWLKNEGKAKHLLITGYNYPGYSEFYLEKYNFDLSKLKIDEFIPKKIKYIFFNETIENTLLHNILQDLSNSYNITNETKFLLFDQTNIKNFSTVDTIVYFSINNIELIESMILLNKFKVEKKIANRENSIYIIRPLNTTMNTNNKHY